MEGKLLHCDIKKQVQILGCLTQELLLDLSNKRTLAWLIVVSCILIASVSSLTIVQGFDDNRKHRWISTVLISVLISIIFHEPLKVC